MKLFAQFGPIGPGPILPPLPDLPDLTPDLPGVGDLLEGIFGWILDQLGISRGNAMETALTVLDKSRRPNVFTEWYAYVFGNSLGLALHAAVAIFALVMFVSMLRRDGWYHIGRAAFTVVALVWWAEFFFFILTPFFQLSDGLARVAKLFGTLPAGNDDNWMDALLGLPDVTDLFGNIVLHYIGVAIGYVLMAETVVIAAGIYFVGILSIFTFLLRNAGKWGARFWRWNVSAFFTIIFAKPVMMFWLAFGSSIIKLGPGLDGLNGQIAISLFVGFMAALSPLILFIAGNVAYSKIEGYVDAMMKGHKGAPQPNEILQAESVDRAARSRGIGGAEPVVVLASADNGHQTGRVAALKNIAVYESMRAVGMRMETSGNPVAMSAGTVMHLFAEKRGKLAHEGRRRRDHDRV